MRRFPEGTKVRLTRKFLRSTMSSEGAKRWHVMPCDCALCARDFVCVDEPSYDGGMRHLHEGNLEHF